MHNKPHKLILYALLLIIPVALDGCSLQEGPALKVEMSGQHDSGRFLPGEGDRLAIAGPFNDWTPGQHLLEDPDGDWVYEIPLSKLQSSTDSLRFKLVIMPGGQRSAPNGGWETLPNRTIARADLVQRRPVLTYNEPWSPLQTAEVTFRVGMANQQVLGFFDPEKGDKVVVTGSFSSWNPGGYPLADPDGDRVYTATLPVAYREGRPVEYKYRIISSGNQQLLPNEGWESRSNRVLATKVPGDSLSTGFAAFNDHRRIARFMVDITRWCRNGDFRPERGDILQLVLSLDGEERIAASFDRVGPGRYETAVQIPLDASLVGWKLVKNVDQSLTEMQPIAVPLEGAQFYWPSSKSFTSKN